ncbi:MAG: DUF1009 domain-containing protein [Acidimicrobiales bacterium]|nr:UDP-2,3-diacylglucosamine diphosphatase LpxI [Hyphomonadaceae bacterium]RZV40658.1 MAG: DUF1009 domain-containing protein [Acidimicrobiales bacterium]
MSKIGLIAGGGRLPLEVLSGATDIGIPVFVARLQGFAKASDFGDDTTEFGLAAFGALIKALRTENCSHVCFAGTVSRPDFRALKPDAGALKRLPGAIKAAAKGDDALLSYIIGEIESEGFEVIAPQALCESALMSEGALGKLKPKKRHQADIDKAMSVAKSIGAMDIGQGAVVCNGLVLAVEAAEGTDAMLERVADLHPDIRGTDKSRAGILAKSLKPQQEVRIDLPTIGVDTIEYAARAGLAGIALVSDKAFVLNKDAVINAADRYGLFVFGLPSTKS